jgi:hypothetical protein
MANLASYFIAGLMAVSVTDYFNPIVGASFGLQGAVNTEPTTSLSTQVVDRPHKGDRLDGPAEAIPAARDVQPIAVRPVRIQVFQRPQPLRLPVGCDALASPLAGSPLSDLAGRCMTDNSGRPKLAAADHVPVSRNLI